MTRDASELTQEIYESSKPIISIRSIGGKRWKRNVATGARIGPWLMADYEILDDAAWKAQKPCLYLVSGPDSLLRYVGISRNRLKDRWRVSPAYDAETMERLPENQLFHSQCWKHIEKEKPLYFHNTYEVRCIDGQSLIPVLNRLGPPLSAFTALGNDYEGIVASVERWICNNRSKKMPLWNVSMTS